ncbi:hypothetical protein [Marivita geojedonensis]|uniref:hypothetical protein n=1 Tax=Marivita geojedonensis TaxID=1123756 RepID=UPI00117C86E7|nr:hypothetical protein [Marivita geojedonensis]
MKNNAIKYYLSVIVSTRGALLQSYHAAQPATVSFRQNESPILERFSESYCDCDMSSCNSSDDDLLDPMAQQATVDRSTDFIGTQSFEPKFSFGVSNRSVFDIALKTVRKSTTF